MKLFLDSANLDHIREIAAWGVIDGVTTNPTLIAQGRLSLQQAVQAIAQVVHGPISAECLEIDAKAMVQEGRALAALHPHVVVKIPLTPQGLACVRELSGEGIRTNVTLCFSSSQGLLAARAGATYISPFVGRLDDLAHDGMQVVRELSEIYQHHGIKTQVLAASIRTPRHVVEAALAGAHVATVPYPVFKKLVSHPLTDAGISQFLKDAATMHERAKDA
jgi:transaldolase